jgi:hypothetical protein
VAWPGLCGGDCHCDFVRVERQGRGHRQSGAPLFTALLIGEDPPDEALDNLPPDARTAVGGALARAKRYRPRIAVPPDGEWFETSLAEQRQRLEVRP